MRTWWQRFGLEKCYPRQWQLGDRRDFLFYAIGETSSQFNWDSRIHLGLYMNISLLYCIGHISWLSCLLTKKNLGVYIYFLSFSCVCTCVLCSSTEMNICRFHVLVDLAPTLICTKSTEQQTSMPLELLQIMVWKHYLKSGRCYSRKGPETINAVLSFEQYTSHVFTGVKRFVYISAADFGVINYLLKGYYEGKVQFMEWFSYFSN